jgi:2-keto-3-deoxy-6-phosphogluconate aldolase
VVVLAGLVVLLVQHRRTDSSGQATAAGPDSTDVAAVLAVLHRHAAALIDRDQQAWAADLDRSAAAAGYGGRQRQVFANLAQAPLDAWRYVLVAPVTDSSVLTPAAARLGGQVVIVHVELQYALAKVDPEPTGKQLWLTGVRRGGGWKLAADDDAAGVGGASWRGPWDFGQLLVRRGPHTLVLAHPAHRQDEAVFADLIETSLPVVTRVWGRDWNDQVAVLIPDTPQEFAAVTGDDADSHDLAAVAVADQVRPDGVVLGARIVVNPANLARLDAAGRRLVVAHELTHIAARAVTSDQMPTWLIEGMADYVGNLDSGLSVAATAAELAADVRAGKAPSALPSDAEFTSSSGLPQAYEKSWLACRLIADRAGQDGLVRFYRVVAEAAGADPATAVATGLRQVLHTDVPAFTAAWRSYLIGQLR